MLLALFASAAVAATTAPATIPAAPATTVSPVTATAAATPSKPKIKCAYEATLGSRLEKKVCRNVADDAMARQQQQQQMMLMQQRGPFLDK